MKIKPFKTLVIPDKLLTLWLMGIILLTTGHNAYAQDTAFKKSSIRTAIGMGVNESRREIGVGLVYSIGWQKSVDNKNKLRINPNITFGEFLPFGILDIRDQFYRMTLLGLNIHYDLVRYKAVSIVTTGGCFINYSRGLLGTGGDMPGANRYSEYFYALYYGGNASIGLRIDPKKSKLAYEIRPINMHVGNKEFVLGSLMFGIDFKLKK